MLKEVTLGAGERVLHPVQPLIQYNYRRNPLPEHLLQLRPIEVIPWPLHMKHTVEPKGFKSPGGVLIGLWLLLKPFIASRTIAVL